MLAVRSFEIVATQFQFQPASIEVSQGDEVALLLRSGDVEHGFALKPYGVKVKLPKGGAPVTVRFVADKPGSFVFSCSSYCGPGHSRMKGKLVVKPRTQ
jgi:cytochrome c oxidase subunit 2